MRSILFLVASSLIFQGSADCGTREVLSPFDKNCICDHLYYRNETTGECVPKKALKVAENYMMSLRTFEDDLKTYILNYHDYLTVSFWAKQLYNRDGIFILRDEYLSISRDNFLNSVTAHIKYESGNTFWSTPSGSFVRDRWYCVIFMHDMGKKLAQIYIDNTILVNVSIAGKVMAESTVLIRNATYNYNVGLMAYVMYYTTTDLQIEYLPLYTHHYYSLQHPKSMNYFNFNEYSSNELYSSLVRIGTDYMENNIEWVEDAPIVCEAKYFFYNPSTQSCQLKKKLLKNSGNSKLVFTSKIGGGSQILLSLWVKQTEHQGNAIQVAQIGFNIFVYANNSAKSYDFVTDAETTHATLENDQDIVGSWCRLIYVHNIRNEYFRRLYLNDRAVLSAVAIGYPQYTVTPLYIFGHATDTASPRFHGFIREAFVSTTVISSNIYAALRNEFYPAHQDICFFYFRMDEQYTDVLISYTTRNLIPLTQGWSYELDDDTPQSCLVRQTYDSSTGTCVSCNGSCDFCEIGNKLCMACFSLSIPEGENTCASESINRFKHEERNIICHSHCNSCDGPTENHCTACIPPLVVRDHQCLCPFGLSPIYGFPPQCVQRCGDGMLYGTEVCDDGNLNNYDGCSTSCKVENYFKCFGGTKYTPDKCYCDLNISSAGFSERWTKVEIVFNNAISLNDSIVGPVCNYLFSSKDLELLGTNPTCSVVYKTITILLGEDSILSSVQVLSILPNTLTIQNIVCKNLAFENITLAKDSYQPSPKAKITGNSIEGLCGNLTLSGAASISNYDPARLTYAWSIIDVVPIWDSRTQLMQTVQTFLNLNYSNASEVVFPTNLLRSEKQYTFRLNVTNYILQTDYTDFKITLKDTIYPEIKVVGPTTQYFYPYHHIVLSVDSSLFVCEDTTTELTSDSIRFAWSFSSSTDPSITSLATLSSTALNLNYIEIFPYRLKPGHSYTVRVQAYINQHTDIQNTQDIVISVLEGDLIAFISGGNRTVFANQNFALDATYSFDSSIQPSKRTIASEFVYSWKCTLAHSSDQNCVLKNGTDVNSLMSGKKKVIFNSKDFESESLLLFSLNVSQNNRSSTSYSFVSIASQESEIESPYILPPFDNGAYINLNQKVVLRGVYEGSRSPSNFEWECVYGSCSNLTFLSSQNNLVTSVILSGTLDSSIVFSLKAIYSGEKIPMSILRVPINFPPSGGTLSVSPLSGIPLRTNFSLEALGWSDAEGHTPLRYEFLASEDENFTRPIPLSDQTFSQSFHTLLWKPKNQNTLFLKVKVTDTHMAQSEAVISVTLSDYVSIDNYTEFFSSLDTVYSKLSQINVQTFLHNIGIISQQVNLAYNFKLSQAIPESTNSTSLLKQNCEAKCLNGGKCISTSSVYTCKCPSGYSYSSSCLLSLNEYTLENTFKTKLLQKVLSLIVSEPSKSTYRALEFSILNEILKDASIISKADKQQILASILSEMKSTISETSLFNEYGGVTLQENRLISEENYMSMVDMAESILGAGQNSLWETDSELAASANQFLQLIAKVSIQASLPGEAQKSFSGKKLGLIAQRISVQDINENGSKKNLNFSEIQLNNISSSYLNSIGIGFISPNVFDISYNSNSAVVKLFGEKYNPQNIVDLIGVLNFGNIGDKMGPYMSLSFYKTSSAEELSVSKQTPFMEYTLPIISERIDQDSQKFENIACVFFDTPQTVWNSAGCKRADNGINQSNQTNFKSVRCKSNHLTLFSLQATDINQFLSLTNSHSEDEFFDFIYSFPFWLIIILLIINLAWILLHKLDVYHEETSKQLQHKLEVITTFFPDPEKHEFVDLFSSVAITKEEIIALIKIGVGLISATTNGTVTVLNTQNKVRPCQILPINQTPKRLTIISSPNGSSERSLDSPNSSPDEDAESRQDSANGSLNILPSTSGSVSSSPKKRIIRGSMLATLFGAVLENKEDEKETPRPTTPRPFTLPESDNLLTIPANIPQYHNGSLLKNFFLSLWRQFPILSLLGYYDQYLPRPLRLVLFTTKMISYIGISGLIYSHQENYDSFGMSFQVAFITVLSMNSVIFLLSAVCLYDWSLMKHETETTKDVQQKIMEILANQKMGKHFLSMREYYPLVNESTRTLLKSVSPPKTFLTLIRRIIGISVALSLSVAFLVYLLLFSNGLDSVQSSWWIWTFLNCVLIDLVVFQLCFTFIFTCGIYILLYSVKKPWALNTASILMSHTCLSYY